MNASSLRASLHKVRTRIRDRLRESRRPPVDRDRRRRAPLRAPALHFLLIGGVCFAAEAWVSGSSLVSRVAGDRVPCGDRAPQMVTADAVATDAAAREGRATIVLTSREVAVLRDSWQRASGRVPTPAEEAELVQRAADEEILYREGLRLLDGPGEEPVRRRLVQLARLLELAPLEDEPALAREARRLGFQENDPVIRRHLIETMRLALASPTRGEEVGPVRLRSYVDEHPERFAEPARVRLTHVYLSRDRHPQVEEDAARLLARLDGGGIAPAEGPALGDPFVRGASLDLTADALDRTFGSGFAARLESLPIARWSGPIASAYGLHAVWVHARIEPRLPSVEAVRGRAVHAMLGDKADARLRDRLDALRRRYRVELQGGAAGSRHQAGTEGLS